MSPHLRFAALSLCACLLAACGEERVSVYQVPKEKDPELPGLSPGGAADAAGAPMADTAVPTAQGSDLLWQAPSGWEAKAASAMRKASYGLPGGCELSVTAFPGDVGGELANVNRWRGQVGLPPLAAGDLEGSVSRLESSGLKFLVAELVPDGGPSAKAILGAMVPYGGSTWFFKISGPASAIQAAKPDFAAFVRTIHVPAQ
jgi:hypothetical protein